MSRNPDFDSVSLAQTLPASLWRRLGAMLYDGLLVLGIIILATFVPVAILNRAISGAPVIILALLVSGAFYCFFWVKYGRTVGMQAWGLRIIQIDGKHPTLNQALRRYLIATLSVMCAGIGHLWMLIEPGGRTWPDLASGTQTVFVPRATKT